MRCSQSTAVGLVIGFLTLKSRPFLTFLPPGADGLVVCTDEEFTPDGLADLRAVCRGRRRRTGGGLGILGAYVAVASMHDRRFPHTTAMVIC